MNALTRRLFLAAAPLALVSPAARAAGAAAGARVHFYAAESGKETLDGDNGAGNPFATALIETMARTDLDLRGARAALAERTAALSGGFMQVDTPGLEAAPAWRFAPTTSERHVALVAVVADYRASDSARSLPGAALDGARVARAFEKAGFETRLVVDPSRAELPEALEAFSQNSRSADAAAIYCTGHGVEREGVQYVLFGDHRVGDGPDGLARAARWDDIAAAAQARKINLLFWAGCRNDPFA